MRVVGKTDIGCVRRTNQDYIFYSLTPVGGFPNLFIVADGMGGHQAGDFASRYAVENVLDYIRRAKPDSLIRVADRAIRHANKKVFEKAHSDEALRGMGTTIVVAYIEDDQLFVANVGDSRVYLYRNGELVQLTEDHTYVNTLLNAGIISQEQAAVDERKNVITKALGAEDTVEPDFFQLEIVKDDILILCTDGLYDEVDERSMKTILEKDISMSDVCAEMVDAANKNGGHDNITVISIKVTEEDVDEQ